MRAFTRCGRPKLRQVLLAKPPNDWTKRWSLTQKREWKDVRSVTYIQESDVGKHKRRGPYCIEGEGSRGVCEILQRADILHGLRQRYCLLVQLLHTQRFRTKITYFLFTNDFTISFVKETTIASHLQAFPLQLIYPLSRFSPWASFYHRL